MAYFVTGATGFIGRHLVEELLRKRDGDVYVLVRAGSTEKLDGLIDGWTSAGGIAPGAEDRIKAVIGDLGEKNLGVADKQVAELKKAGVAELFTPGSSTLDIVDWVRNNLQHKSHASA